ncbi:hypothetical protein EON82_24935, partial [bacterium]
MSDALDICVQRALATAWAQNGLRREYMAFSLGNWPIDDLIGAPLCLTDLLIAARRELGAVRVEDVLASLDRFTVWKLRTLAPFGRGTYDYRLVGAGPERSVLLRLGEHPNNGLMCVLMRDESPNLEAEVFGHLRGAPLEEGIPLPSVGLSRSQLDGLVESELENALEGDGSYSAQGIASEIAEKLGNPPEEEHDVESVLAAEAQLRITSWSTRLALVSLQSTLGDVLAYDLV